MPAFPLQSPPSHPALLSSHQLCQFHFLNNAAIFFFHLYPTDQTSALGVCCPRGHGHPPFTGLLAAAVTHHPPTPTPILDTVAIVVYFPESGYLTSLPPRHATQGPSSSVPAYLTSSPRGQSSGTTKTF